MDDTENLDIAPAEIPEKVVDDITLPEEAIPSQIEEPLSIEPTTEGADLTPEEVPVSEALPADVSMSSDGGAVRETEFRNQ